MSYFPRLPSNYNSHSSLQHATKFKLCSESLLSMPRSAVVDGIVSYGGTTGSGPNITIKAFSEYFERNHLFLNVPIDKFDTIQNFDSDQHRELLLSLCSKSKRHTPEILEHKFALTNVKNIFSQATKDYFFNALSLYGVEKDKPYLTITDSCGCAAHPLKNGALDNSLMEFIERQALLASWTKNDFRFSINPTLLFNFTEYDSMLRDLLDNGDIFIFENNLNLPGYTVMMFYFSHSASDIVQYSVGSSSGSNIKDCLNSALIELYQCYSFLYNTECSSGLADKAGSTYHLKFQQCNNLETKDKIPFFKQTSKPSIDTIEDLNNLKKYNVDEMLEQLKLFSENIFYYQTYDKSLKLHFTKIMSPDYFPHMPLKYLEFNNKFAKSFGLTKENAYLMDIPFP